MYGFKVFYTRYQDAVYMIFNITTRKEDRYVPPPIQKDSLQQ